MLLTETITLLKTFSGTALSSKASNLTFKRFDRFPKSFIIGNSFKVLINVVCFYFFFVKLGTEISLVYTI